MSARKRYLGARRAARISSRTRGAANAPPNTREESMTRIGRTTTAFSAALVLSTAMALWSASARADSNGLPGKLVGFEHNDDSSDDFGLREGRVFVEEEGGTIRGYSWGSSLCPNRTLSTAQLEFLLRAMEAKWVVLPYFKVGNGATRCLVSFGFARKGYVDDVSK